MSIEENAPAINEEVNNTEEVVESSPQEETTESVDLSAQFIEIQRREKALRDEQNKMNKRLEDEKAKWIQELTTAPIEKLNEYGVKADTLASSFLNLEPAHEPTAEEQMKHELESLKQWKAQQEQEYNNRVLADYQNEVISVVENDPDGEFELINNHKGGKDLYWETVVAYYQETGTAPDYKEVAKNVEAHLEAEARKLLGLKKFATKEEVVQATEEKKENEAPAEKKPNITLNSNMTGRSVPKVKMVENAMKYTVGSEFSRQKYQREQELAEKFAKALKSQS